MKVRSLLITIIALFAMVLGGVAAQDMPMMDDCFNLSADDCAVINEASANGIGDATSFTVEIEVAFEAAGIPDETMPVLDFAMGGVIDVTEGMGMMVPVNIGGAFEAESEALGMPLALEFALVDDFAYFTDPFTGEWSGVDVIALLSSEEFSGMLEGLMEGDTSALGFDAPDLDVESLMPLLAVLEVPGLMTYERDGDDFIFSIDLSVLADPENAELLGEIDAALAEVDPEMAGMAAALPMLLSEGTIDVIQSVNTDLNIVDNYELDMYFEVQMGPEPTTVELYVNVALTNFDSAPAAEAPAEFTDMTGEITGEEMGG